MIECRARGKLKKDNIKPLVGDLVDITVISPAQGVLESLEPRRNSLLRPSVANIDQLILVFAATNPEPDFLLMDRLTVLAEKNNLDVVICITKTDIDDNKNTLEKIKKRFSHSGFKIIGVSSPKGTGLEEIKQAMQGKVSTLSGPSGVGKSTLINTLNPSFKITVGEISNKTKRGKHTTTNCELLEVSTDSFVVDTPGFTSLELEGVKVPELGKLFPEFTKFTNQCQFTSCIHENEKVCGVKDALELGNICDQRYKNYLLLLNEIRESGGIYR